MKEEEDAIREELRRLARDLESIRFRLWGIAAKLPGPEGEDETEPEEPSVRSVIECVVMDSITPAIEDLTRASGEEEGGGG
ncbi:MAG: hypothetical protein QOF89_1689 [Acidobacteriota bacterium]|jgi:hypothetical protein|nr:hypothetical protein [Acidobacteriota bacterium]